MKNPRSYLAIHGHFYQPPRENSWLEEIELQESAAPFHDWNERIHQECYLPNAKARVIDERGRIVDIVNNYMKLSFNFGPTLMAWLEKKHPDTYREILVADRESARLLGGHGNAIAQVYNHMIMPLATRRDKVTQVRWGVAEFRHRFNRNPEAIWLAETAVNEETLEVLVEEHMKFLILAPHQAEVARPFEEADGWRDVCQGQIDPRRPYRCFLKKDPSRYIDIFFYDGPLAKGMGFENLLFDTRIFMDRIEMATSREHAEPQIIHAATDGETFGHHKAFGERVLAYLLNGAAPDQGYLVTNYGYYLEHHPPQWAVRLKEGEAGEGTAWSCSHGVSRWKDHCGCRGDGPVGWTQHWRKPLREALDGLRDELAVLFEKAGAAYLRDPWEARNNYVRVVMDRHDKSLQAFFSRHALRPLSPAEQVVCLKLLEMQRHSLLMYTSCGWFFTELSGIETMQVIEYAARAIQLAGEISGEAQGIESRFLEKMAQAKSNIPEYRDGRNLYEKFIIPRIITLTHMAGFYGILSLIPEAQDNRGEEMPFYCFRFRILHERRETFGDLSLSFGRVKVQSMITHEEADFLYIAVHMGLYDFRCSVKPFGDFEEIERLEREFFDELHAMHLVELLRKMDRAFGERYFALKDLPLRERMRIITILTREVIEKISTVHENLFDENRRMSEIYRSINLPIPEEIRYAAEHTLRLRMNAAVRDLAVHGFNLKKAGNLTRILDSAKAFNVDIGKSFTAVFLSRELAKRTSAMIRRLDPDLIAECLNIHKLAKKIRAELELGRAQEHLYQLVKAWCGDPERIPAGVRAAPAGMLQLLSDLNINQEAFKKALQDGVAVQE